MITSAPTDCACRESRMASAVLPPPPVEGQRRELPGGAARHDVGAPPTGYRSFSPRTWFQVARTRLDWLSTMLNDRFGVAIPHAASHGRGVDSFVRNAALT